MKRFILRHPAFVIAWGVSALMALGLAGVWIFRGEIANDFSVYWRTTNSPIQWAYWEHWPYPFPYMPTMILWAEPLQLIELWPAFFLWSAISVTAIVLACRRYLPRAGVVLVLASPPVTNGLMTGQVSAVCAALMLWACGASNRNLAGVAFGVVATIKPQLVIMAPLFLLLNRDWRAIFASAATFLTVVALSILNYGVGIWIEWYGFLNTFRDKLNEMLIIDVGATPAAVAESFGLPPIPFLLLGACLGAWIVYQCRKAGPLEVTAAIGLGSLLAAPYALTYDLIVVAPFLVACVFRRRIAAAVALSGVLPPFPVLLAAYELGARHGLGFSFRASADVEKDSHPARSGNLEPVRDLV